MKTAGLAVIAAFAAFTGCGETKVTFSDDGGAVSDGGLPDAAACDPENKKVDILFLLDNSGSMAQEQQMLAEGATEFLAALTAGGIDFHIGMVTTDVNFNPLTECKPGGECPNGMGCVRASWRSDAVNAGDYYCVAPSESVERCLRDADCPNYQCNSQGDCTPSVCGRIKGFDDNRQYCHPQNSGRLRFNSCRKGYSTSEVDDRCELAGAHEEVLTSELRNSIGDQEFLAMFRDNVRAGTNGTGFEKGLYAVRAALDSSHVDPVTGANLATRENAGFYRNDAALLVVFVSDEEDCSHDPSDHNFDEKKDTNEACYPSPNTCHPDCQPREASKGCNTTMYPPEEGVVATENSEYAAQGVGYCMIPCASDSDCENSPVSGMTCGAVPGFGGAQYCNCAFDRPTVNANSKYAYLSPVQDYIDFLKATKTRPDLVRVAAIVGADASGQADQCASPNGVACAGSRYVQVAAAFDRNSISSICAGGLGPALTEIASRLAKPCE
ncbi:MAG: VWA domain-containing protein [Deltaproteobacteria bacterium]|nr:VWA domain-containing protein [Deltaproteobacteria bacterium]